MDHRLAERLRMSGLTPAHAETLGLVLRPAADLKNRRLPRAATAIEIPYFSPAGEQNGFARYRFLDGGTPKYGQAAGTTPHVYFPPLVEWSAILADPAEPLILTEGEFKAACGCVHVAPTLGLGGVWMFKRGTTEFLPVLDQIAWKGREVYIAFDSDTVTNTQVLHARNALCEVLTAREARPHILVLPPAANGAKQGLDDFVVGGGDVTALVEEAEPWESARLLHRLNEEVIYIHDPGCLVKRQTGTKLAPSAFKEHAYATWTYLREVATAKGMRRERVSAPAEWLKWPGRLERERMVYEPGQPEFTADGYNTWTGWGVEPEKGDTTLWEELLDYLFDGHTDEIAWFEKWCAYPLQHPGEKLYTAVVLWGRTQGTGKTLVGYTLGRIYGENFIELKEEHLHNDFNFWAENRQFVLGDEITGGDKRGMADRLKGMVTQSEVIVNPKHINQYRVRDCINYLFTSNHPDAFFLEDQDRRFFVHEVRQVPKEQAWYERYDAWYKSPEVGAVFHRLLHLDTRGFHPRNPAPMTEDKKVMIAMGRSDLSNWVATLKDYPEEVLIVGGTAVPWTLASADDLLRVYDPTGRSAVKVGGMAKELSRQGFVQVAQGETVRTKHGHKRLWAIRNRETTEQWSGGEAARQYNKERD